MKFKLWPLLFSFILCTSCSGGHGLGGDSGDDPAADPAADPGSDNQVDIEDASSDPMDEGRDVPPDPAGDVIPPDAPDPCLAQDARAYGPCQMILDAVAWDGEHCVALGSGCGCEGEDCDSVYETVEDCVEARRGCYDQTCDPQPVADDMCIDCTDEMYLGAFWNGIACFELRGCGCAGEGCDAVFSSIYECQAVQAQCAGILCRESGGQWFPAEAGFCGFECGGPLPYACEAPMASCKCATGKTLVSGEGCVDDPACTPEDLCLATRGIWYPEEECYCGFWCGEPTLCYGCLDSCDCGPHRNFNEEKGCVPDDECDEATQQDICEFTGGSWVMNTCGHYGCGIPSPLACVEPGCDCGAISNYDEEHGCVYDESCVFRDLENACIQEVMCRPGLACCYIWGMAPAGECVHPCCADHPSCGESGCPPSLG